jgi:hypothetical protein
MKIFSFDNLASQLSDPIRLAILAFVFIACFGLIFFTKKPSVNIDNGLLTIKSLFFGKTISVGDINVNGVKHLNLKEDKDYNIRIRTFGIGLPNYYVGWMRLNNGNKALVYLKDRQNVVLIPTNKYDILVSSDDFVGIKEALNKTIN